MRRDRRTWSFIALVLAAPILATIAVVISWSRLGDVVDTFAPWPPWDPSEMGAGSLSGALFVTWASAVAAVVSVGMVAADVHRSRARSVAVATPYFAWFYSLGVLRSVILELTGESAEWWQLVTMVVLAASLASVARSALPRHRPADGPIPVSRLTFGPDTRVVWTGMARGRWAGIVSAVAGTGAAVLLWWSVADAAALGIVAVMAAASRSLRMRITERGIRASAGRFDWRATDVLISQVVAARAEPHDRWSGWFSGSLEGVGQLDERSRLFRSGGQLILLTADRPVVISVDDAEEAADVVNALVARERARTTLANDARHP